MYIYIYTYICIDICVCVPTWPRMDSYVIRLRIYVCMYVHRCTSRSCIPGKHSMTKMTFVYVKTSNLRQNIIQVSIFHVCMYMCPYVCIYAGIIYACMYVCMQDNSFSPSPIFHMSVVPIRMHSNLFIYGYIYIYIYTYIYLCMHVCLCVCVSIYKSLQKNTCAYKPN